ncbi:pentapeptide repeat-containing protein [Pantoea sp. B65]|uniref:pentapeptide repeat-containing protein n=1 Tax=Pantoea sp. B65 TaxID=2813359 RepID=UPI0039B43195
MNFIGKWSFQQNNHYLTLDENSQQLTLSGTAEGNAQKWNAYGTPEQFILQAPNGKYVFYHDNVYLASLGRDDAMSYFSLVITAGQNCNIIDLGIQGAGSEQYWWTVNGTSLERVAKSAIAPDSALLMQDVITVGMEQFLNFGFPQPQPDLTWVYLAGQDLSSCIGFIQANFTQANLSGANLSGVPMNSGNFTHAIVTNANLSGFSTALTNARLINADFTGTRLNSAQLLAVDFTGANLSHVDMTDASLSQPNFTDANLTGVKMSNPSTGGGFGGSIDLTQMTFSNKTCFTLCQMRYNDLRHCDFTGMVFNHADLTGCRLDKTTLDCADMSYCNLSGTSVTGNVSMVGANFSNATLTGADMTGAQMGSISLRFRVSGSANVIVFQTALTQDDITTVQTVFRQNGYPLTGDIVITTSPYAADRVWTVQTYSASYTVRKEGQDSGASLAVYQTAVAAILANAFMKDIILTSANLFNVRAPGAQIYGSAKLDGNAILEGAQFDNANMGGINLKQAQLYGVNFDYATLTGAQFQGAELTVAATGGAVSLTRANLQGANFSDSKLADAIFTDAAVSVADPLNASVTWGVWLFDTPDSAELSGEISAAVNSVELAMAILPYIQQGKISKQLQAGFRQQGITISDSALVTIQQFGPYWTLTDAATSYVIFQSCDSAQYQPALGVAPGANDTVTPQFFIPLYLESQLKTGTVTPDVIAAFRQNGQLTLSAGSQVAACQQATDWLVTDVAVSYNLWRGLNKFCELTLTARAAIPNLLAVFNIHSLPLSSRALVSSNASGGWLLDNDADNPFNPVINYIKFTLISDLATGNLSAYGQMMRVVRLSAQGQQEFENLRCDLTLLDKNMLQSSTVCPNSARTDVNNAAGTPFINWMRAQEMPKAPFCVPSADGTYYCPQKPPSSPLSLE